jgi:hypothetical protein
MNSYEFMDSMFRRNHCQTHSTSLRAGPLGIRDTNTTIRKFLVAPTCPLLPLLFVYGGRGASVVLQLKWQEFAQDGRKVIGPLAAAA